MAKAYKVIAPCFFGGVYRTPDNKHNRVVLKQAFKDGECPSYLEPVDAKPEQDAPEGDDLDGLNHDELIILANQEYGFNYTSRNKPETIIKNIRKKREEQSAPVAVEEMDRGQLVTMAEGLEIDFDDDTSDEELAAKIQEAQA